MKPARDIDWRLPSQLSTTRGENPTESSFLLHCNSITHFSDARINEFIKKCNANGDETALETILFPLKKKRKTNLRDQVFLASLYNENNEKKSVSELIDMGTSMFLDISDEEVQEISRVTLPQHKSKSYIGLQRGRITGSNFMSCCVASIADPCIATINRIINPVKLDNGASVKFQNKNRVKAIDQYKRTTAVKHDDFQYSPCGLIINQNFPYFAASPDGLINCDCHGDGCVIVKCLKILSSGASIDMLTSKPNHILNIHENEYFMEESHEFYYQIQLQIHLIEL